MQKMQIISFFNLTVRVYINHIRYVLKQAKFCTNLGPCTENGQTLGSYVYQRLIYGTHKIVVSETTRPRAYLAGSIT